MMSSRWSTWSLATAVDVVVDEVAGQPGSDARLVDGDGGVVVVDVVVDVDVVEVGIVVVVGPDGQP